MSAQHLNQIGLVLGMAGVVVIFIWGPPQPNLDDVMPLVLEHSTAPDFSDTVRRKKNLHKKMSRFGLGLIFFGFAFQLWASC